MNLVFMNRMERQVKGARQTGTVSIGEKDGTWLVMWEITASGGAADVSFWYEGSRWDDMLLAFRMGVQEKKREGFIPWIDDVGGPAEIPSGRRPVSLLQYYAEHHRHNELYEELRKWRRVRSGRDGKTPYMIATNRLLEMIAAYVPQRAEELRQIPGMSANKTGVYGDEILAVTRNYAQPQPFPLDWVEASVDPLQLELWLKDQREARERMAVQKQELKRKMLEAVAEGLGLDELAGKLSLQRKEIVIWAETLDREGYDMEPLIAAELSSMSEEEQRKAADAMREEGTVYLKPIYNRIYGNAKLAAADINAAYERIRLLRIRYRQMGQPSERNEEEVLEGRVQAG